MIDPYVYNNSNILKNKLNLKNAEEFEKAEAAYTSFAILKMQREPVQGKFDFTHFSNIHKRIFEEIYEWAGKPRIIDIEKEERSLGGLSIEYEKHENIEASAKKILSKMNAREWEKMSIDEAAVNLSEDMAALWKVHSFREGNTRTTVIFICDFAESKGFPLDRNLFKDNSEYVRTSLVAYNAKFSDIGDYSQPEHLIKIMKDSLIRGKERAKDSAIVSDKKQYSHLRCKNGKEGRGIYDDQGNFVSKITGTKKEMEQKFGCKINDAYNMFFRSR